MTLACIYFDESVYFHILSFQGDEGVRSWERPWSLEEMRKGAGNWSLAGDAGVISFNGAKALENLLFFVLHEKRLCNFDPLEPHL